MMGKYRRIALWSAMALAAAVVGLSASLTGQTPSVLGAEAVRTLVAKWSAKDFTPPKTPWGDPDISGVFTTKDEANTPFEVPDEWKGRRMEDITPQEFAEALVKRQQQAVERAPFAGGGEDLITEGVAIAVPIHWFDNLQAANSRPWFVIDPPDGKVPALAPDAAAHRSKNPGFLTPYRNTYLDRSITDRCIAFTFRMPSIYGNSYQILQTPDYVAFRREQIHEARIIPLKDRPLANIIGFEGQSAGHWDGNTLVVETTRFDERVPFRGYTAKGLRVIERFTRIADKKVEYSTTVIYPEVYSQPWTYSYPFTEDDTQPIFEYACHEGNYGMANLLSAGRAADKKESTKGTR